MLCIVLTVLDIVICEYGVFRELLDGDAERLDVGVVDTGVGACADGRKDNCCGEEDETRSRHGLKNALETRE